MAAHHGTPVAVIQRLESDPDQLRRGRLPTDSRYILQGNDHRLPLRVPADAKLRLGFAAPRTARAAMPRIVVQAVFESDGERDVLLRRTIGGPGQLPFDTWHDVRLSLRGIAYRSGQLHLSAAAEDGHALADGAVLWTNPTVQTPGAVRGTNIILISIDTLRADRLGCYGSARDTSPHIDRLASEGVRFSRALASSNWTLPSHASMLTGFDPHHHGALRDGRDALRAEIDTLAEQLWRAGYQTGGFVGGGFVDAQLGFDQGFDRYWSSAAQSFDSIERNAAEAMRWIEQRADSPFFVFLHSYQVHMPYNPPPPFDRLFDPEYDGPLRGNVRQLQRGLLIERPRVLHHAKALYDGLIRYSDRTIGDLMTFLQTTGLAGNTCVVLTSDHGEEFLEHGGLLHGLDHLYDEVLHVPLIVWCPSRFKPGVQDGVVSLVDVAPTILEIAGVPVPSAIQGRSLASLLSGSPGDAGRMVVSATESGVPAAQGALFALTSDRYRVIGSTRGARPREIYDLGADPDEQANLWDTRPDLRQELGAELNQVLGDAQAIAPRPTPDPNLDAALKERLRALGYLQ